MPRPPTSLSLLLAPIFAAVFTQVEVVGQAVDANVYKSKVTPLVEAMLAEDESMIDASVATLLGGSVEYLVWVSALPPPSPLVYAYYTAHAWTTHTHAYLLF